jgi:hypothetical protein
VGFQLVAVVLEVAAVLMDMAVLQLFQVQITQSRLEPQDKQVL